MRHLLALLISFMSFNAMAATASNESIEKLLTITKAEQLLDSSYTEMGRTFIKNTQINASDKKLNAKQQQLVAAFPAKIMTLVRKDYGWDTYKPKIVKIYSDVFSQEEIDGLLAFYASPAGQANINKMPQVMQQTIQLTQSMAQTILPKMQVLVEQQSADLEAAKSAP
jgi:hypothetical protein